MNISGPEICAKTFWGGRTVGRTVGRSDGQTDGRSDGRMYTWLAPDLSRTILTYVFRRTQPGEFVPPSDWAELLAMLE